MSYVPPKKNAAYVVYIGLTSQADVKSFVTNPTIASGDFKVSVDGGSLATLTTLPVVTPAGSKVVKIALSAAEMNGDTIVVVGSDAAGAEWCDTIICIHTSAQQIDDLSQAGDAMTLTSGERDAIAAALLDLASAIDGKTLRQAMRYIAAVVAGKISGSGTGTEVAKGLDGSTTRVTFTVSGGGNRTGVSYD